MRRGLYAMWSPRRYGHVYCRFPPDRPGPHVGERVSEIYVRQFYSFEYSVLVVLRYFEIYPLEEMNQACWGQSSDFKSGLPHRASECSGS